MSFTTVIGVETAVALVGRADAVFIDCRFQLYEPEWGHDQYLKAHIPRAGYAHLDRDLSGQRTGQNGRHPLPDVESLRAVFGRLGITHGVQVIAYDQDSSMYASRLWWLLRWMGHREVAVLDGGFAAWHSAHGATRSGEETCAAAVFDGEPDPTMVALLQDVVALVAGVAGTAAQAGGAPGGLLLDARAPERFRGDVEPLDNAAGHIPGAMNHYFKDNVDEAGRFLTPDALRARFAARLGTSAPDHVVAYCGSGVTACHNLLALERAGLAGARLYPGSWSEWSSDPRRPIATGD